MGLGGGSESAWVMEVLRVDWYLGMENALDPSSVNWGFLTTVTAHVDAETATLATLSADTGDPLTFAFAIQQRLETGASGGQSLNSPVSMDTTDGAGNGILVATDRLFIVGGNVNGATASSFNCKMYYRLIEVGIQEYVGIVQSQQG